MSDSSALSKSCPQCGAALPADATEGLCPRCLMAEAMQPTAPRPAGGAWQPPSPEELQVLMPGYTIERLLGKGGMGAVYQGVQENLDRPVAIKIISNVLDEADASYGERFKNEARAMAKLSHPGIVAVFDFGQTANGLLFIVMEYIEGTDVARMIAQQKRLHTDHAMAITAHVCDALAYAHERGIIHRDIKPANIMVSHDGVVKVADFGLAKMTKSGESGLTQSGMAMGTLHYMAPEALMLGTAVDHRADIYAVGVMLYQMLTGRVPQGIFELPSMQVPGLDPRYDAIIAQAMREDRDIRYQSVRELRSSLDHILTQPVMKVDPQATRAPAAVPAQAEQRPSTQMHRSAGQPYRPPQSQTVYAPPKSSPLPWVIVTAAVVGLAAWFLLGRSKPGAVAAAGAASPVSGSADSGTTDPAAATKSQPFVNTLGMKFVPVPGTQALFSIWETRVRDYETYALNSKVDGSWARQEKYKQPVSRGPDDPVAGVNWDDANAFCEWLTTRERAEGKLPDGVRYRLPTDAEWSLAAKLPPEFGATPEEKHERNKFDFPWGRDFPPKSKAANIADTSFHDTFFDATEGWERNYTDGYASAAPVGSFAPNSFGIYDLGGNVSEWCEDWYEASREHRVARGSAWINHDIGHSMSSHRVPGGPKDRGNVIGFRCVLAPATTTPQVVASNSKSQSGSATSTPAPAAVAAGAAAAPAGPAPDSQDLRRGLVSWWKADGDARDAVGANHGKLVGAASFADGHFGRAFQFDGGYVEIPDAPSLQFGPTSKFTVALWASRSSAALPTHLFGKRLPNPAGSSTLLGYQLGLDGSSPKSPLNEWVFWTLVSDGVKQALYINGEWAGKGNPVGPVNNASFLIGRSAYYTSFKGKIDDVRVYDRAMTPAEIKALYEWREPKPDPARVEISTIPELAALQQQLIKLQAERVTAVFAADVAKLNSGYLGGLDREMAKERAAGRLDGVLALETEKKLITAREPVPATDDAGTSAALKNLRSIYREAYAKLEAARMANSKALTGPLAQRLKTLESELTKQNRIADAKAVRDYREALPAAESAAAYSAASPFVNSLGMKFVPVPGTEVLFCIHETRRKDYSTYALANAGVDDRWKAPKAKGKLNAVDDNHPVEETSWEDAHAFCAWLSRKEGRTYRLPTDREWSFAVGIGERESATESPESLNGKIKDVFPWGSTWPPPPNVGNYYDTTALTLFRPKKTDEFAQAEGYLDGFGYTDGFATSAPVMSFPPNSLGIYDLGGNTYEVCEDEWSATNKDIVFRGASWGFNGKDNMLSCGRVHVPKSLRIGGFRIVVVAGSVGAGNMTAAKIPAPPPAAAPQMPAASVKPPAAESTATAAYTNTLGMKFVPVPGTQILLCIHETRRADYAAYAAATPNVNGEWATANENGVPVSTADDHPAVNLRWADAQAFCEWLSKKEGASYRLPTDREWSIAVGIGNEEKADASPEALSRQVANVYPWGNRWPPPQGAGNYADKTTLTKFPTDPVIDGYDDGFATTAPVMSFKPNKLGLYDLGGNAMEWVSDWWNDVKDQHVLRGHAWKSNELVHLLSSNRSHYIPGSRHTFFGCRVALVATSAAAAAQVAPTPTPTPTPTPPVNTAQVPAGGLTNTLGMKFVPVPGTSVLFCIHETRRQDYAAYAAQVPGVDDSWTKMQETGLPCGHENGHPVVGVSWEEAVAFCQWLSKKEDKNYRLPTDEEWSQSVGIGKEELRPPGTVPEMLSRKVQGYPWGTGGRAGNYADISRQARLPAARFIADYNDGYATTSPVMTFPPDKLGLYDLSGNVWEWVEDWLNAEQKNRVLRGGSFTDAQGNLMSSHRVGAPSQSHSPAFGFRVVLGAVKTTTTPPAAAAPATSTSGTQPKNVVFENTLGMKFVPLPGTKSLVCIHETRKGDYAAFAAENPAADLSWRTVRNQYGTLISSGNDHPVVNVTWQEAMVFCAWLSKKEGKTYRLPTDREWSIAAGLGSKESTLGTPQSRHDKIKDAYSWGSTWPPPAGAGNFADVTMGAQSPDLKVLSTYNDGYATTSPVMSFTPNALGLYDISGNAWELIDDWYNASKKDHLMRGGAFDFGDREWLNLTARDPWSATSRLNAVGFRILVDVPSP